MIRQFIRDMGLYGISTFISRGVSILLVPFYTRVLSPSDYGTMDIIAVFYSIVSIIVPLEITQAIARFMADNNNADLDSNQNTILISSIGLIFTLITFSSFLILGLIFSPIISKLIFSSSDHYTIIIVALFHMFFTGLFYFFSNQLRWTLKAKKVAILSITYTIINIISSIFFVLILKTGVIGVFYSLVISGVTCSIQGYIFSRKNYSFIFSISKLKEMLRFSLPLVPSSVGVFFIDSGQRLIVKGLMTLADLGILGIGSRISSVINLGFQSVQGAIVPLIYQNHTEANTPASLSKIFRFLSFFLIIFFLTISLFSKEILILLTRPAYFPAFKLIPFLVLSEIFGGLQRSFTPGMAIRKRTDIIAYVNILGAISSLILSFILIYFFGLLGASIAACSQSILMFCILMIFSQKFYFIPYPFARIASSILLALFIILFFWIIQFNLSVFLLIILKLAIIATFILLQIKLFRIISINEIIISLN